jgi:uncharacterized protein YqgC (DUF456 family)
MAIALPLVVGALLVTGLVGAIVPFLPGTPLILIGALVYAIATDFSPIGGGRLVILGALTGLGYLVEYAGVALGARRSGGSRWAVAGAVAGAIVGVFFGPLGLLLGPAVGAVGAELIRGGQLEASLRTGLGAVVGIVAGAVAHFTVAVIMVGLFVWWAWRG